jgi:hypothetical protein
MTALYNLYMKSPLAEVADAFLSLWERETERDFETGNPPLVPLWQRGRWLKIGFQPPIIDTPTCRALI